MGKNRQVNKYTQTFWIMLSGMKNKCWCAGKEMGKQGRPHWWNDICAKIWMVFVPGQIIFVPRKKSAMLGSEGKVFLAKEEKVKSLWGKYKPRPIKK